MAGLLLLAIVLILLEEVSRIIQFMARALLVMKIGGFPFHAWLLNLGRAIRWESLLLLLTLQKILPLAIMASLARRGLFWVRAAGWVALVLIMMLVKQAKKLLIVSSVFFLIGVVLTPLLGGPS